MSQTEQSWKRINEKLQQVLHQYQLLQKDNDRLQAALKEHRLRDAAQAKQIGELESKVAALKLATGQLTEADKKDVEKRLHQYIRDIDRCIAMLSE